MSIAQIKTFESQTKLLVTGEYYVLKGAQALALPLKFSQKLMVKTGNEGPILVWESRIHGQQWFSASLLPDFSVKETNSKSLSSTLSGILKAAASLNANFKIGDSSCRVISDMNFNPGWGVGSSSSLVSNIAHWADCDPFELNNLTFNGSGYDIACARSTRPIVYKKQAHLPIFREANFHPTFHQSLYFVYLNRKQNSRTSLQELDQSRITPTGIQTINRLTDELIAAKNLNTFQRILEEHEEITGKMLGKEPVQKLLFSDFQGSVKSLGAWGGDFVLAASDAPEAYVRNYFDAREFKTMFNYREIVRI
jgi:mevalonate kinase